MVCPGVFRLPYQSYLSQDLWSGAKDDQSIRLRVRGICSFGVQRFIFANTGPVETQFGSPLGRKVF